LKLPGEKLAEDVSGFCEPDRRSLTSENATVLRKIALQKEVAILWAGCPDLAPASVAQDDEIAGI
jgi:hypothetical protein